MDRANPCGLNGFSFVEFSAVNNSDLQNCFRALGFSHTKTHKNYNLSLFEQGNIKFIINSEKNTQATEHAIIHGTGPCAMGFMVENSTKAFEAAVANGATPARSNDDAHLHPMPAIEAIGGSVIYFADNQNSNFADWNSLPQDCNKQDTNLLEIDHLTHNVYRGNMDRWADFYCNIFNFREIRYFDIKGKITGLVSRAMSSPCGKIKIPLNESTDSKSQIEEFLQEYNGEGIQHIALSTSNIYQSIRTIRQNGISFLDVPNSYYEMIANRIPWHQEPVDKLKQEQILIDGEKSADHGLLLQIFTKNLFGPVFFEIIQRKGNEGFGEGNFQALFEAIERDQIERGVL